MGHPKQIPRPRTNVKQLVYKSEDLILPPPVQFRDDIIEPPKKLRNRPKKPTRPPPLAPFDFADVLFQTDNKSVGKFEIISTRSTQNKKFKSYTNEFRIKILQKLDNTNKVYQIFQELIRTTKRRRKLSDNDRLSFVIENEELHNSISMKFNQVKDFALGDLENVIRILEY